MKRLYMIPAALGILTFAAAAQDEHAALLEKKLALEKMTAQVHLLGVQGGVMSKTIKGAPYSGVEVNESTQMLADGTRIHNESQTQVYRDSEGTRIVSTIEAGAIGNDRPIQSLTERWFSPELQTVMLTRNSDPRMGEEVFKLINVNRAEPAAYLFQVPAGYQVVEGPPPPPPAPR